MTDEARSKEKNLFIAAIFYFLSYVPLFFYPHIAAFLNDTHLPPMTRPVRFLLIGFICLIFALYLAVMRFLKMSGISLYSKKGIFLFWLPLTALYVSLCFSPAVFSVDLYEYPIRARMLSVYGLNPYLHVPNEISGDMFYPFIFWKNAPECYGPLWVIIGAAYSVVFKGSMFLILLAHKAVLLMFLLASVFFFRKIAEILHPIEKDALTAAFAANPLVLIMTMVDGHNEIAMVGIMLSAVYLLLKKKNVLAFILLALAVNVKFTYLLAGPFFLAYALWHEEVSFSKRISGIFWGCFFGAVVTVSLWSVFGMDSFRAIIKYYKDLSVLLWPDSIPYAVWVPFDKLKFGVTLSQVAGIFSVLFAIFYAWALLFLSKRSVVTAIAMTFLILLFTNATPFQSWYVLWALPFLLLSEIRAKVLLCYMLSFFLIFVFWKRMSVLAIPMMVLYFGLLRLHRCPKI